MQFDEPLKQVGEGVAAAESEFFRRLVFTQQYKAWKRDDAIPEMAEARHLLLLQRAF